MVAAWLQAFGRRLANRVSMGSAEMCLEVQLLHNERPRLRGRSIGGPA